ncbi:CrcB-like protein-domain-containing protein [Calycina marina]|uniref:CrcB-like protein-domain-containing protein n=1 Tax=Calycina marina TaxID=1763456 RepID=A0A9P7YXC9_9HELO|nr:CrcB-like protein-domain-containing protein [Calycina marina]
MNDDTPELYGNLDECIYPTPVENLDSQSRTRHLNNLEDIRDDQHPVKPESDGPIVGGADTRENDESDEYLHIDELAGPSHVENTSKRRVYEHHHVEEERVQEEAYERDRAKEDHSGNRLTRSTSNKRKQYITQLYVTSYLILFSILGTLARLGLTALTTYPGAPVIITELWANASGCFFMGWLSEDRFVFRKEWFTAQDKARGSRKDTEEITNTNAEARGQNEILAAVKIEHNAAKKTVPLFIGLAVGFCGSFTSFSSFIHDIFLALDNGLVTPTYSADGLEVEALYSLSPGDRVMSGLAVVLLEVSLCLCALQAGADFAIAIEPVVTQMPTTNLRRFLDPLAVFIAWGAWSGSIIMSIWPPDRPGGPAADGRTTWEAETWRGQVILALVFAPVGCLLRFHASLCLNGKLKSFPLGTFVVNMFGTVILGMAWDLQRAPLGSGLIGGGEIGCQVLQGIQDGFCGCLTTVSTLVLELKGLQRKHAYIYGGASAVLGFCFLITIMGSLVWTNGPSVVGCTI